MRVFLIDKNLVDPVHRAKWRHLARLPGIELAALAPDRWVENYRTIYCRPAPEDGFPIFTLPVVWPGRENRAFYTRGLEGMLRRHRPDVVIAFEEPFSVFAAQVTLAARGAKRVFYSWDNLSDGRRYPYRPAFFYRAVERRVGKRADAIWCANEDALRRFARDYPGKARLLPFGLDLVRFPGRDREPPVDAGFIVGYAGRLVPMKGIETLVEALAQLPDTCRLVLLGSGPHRAALATLAERLGVSGRVSFREGVPSEGVAEELRNFHALVLPSRTTSGWKEQFGRVIVEAMSIGIPIVGSSSGSIPEVIGDAGVVFPEGNGGALAAALRRLLSAPEERARLAARGRERATMWSAERFAENAARLLQGTVAG